MIFLKRQIGNIIAVVGLIVLAVAIGGYIVVNQRLKLPFIHPEPLKMEVVLEEANSVIPGQGQTAQVAGVQIGSVREVSLEDGRAVVGLDIEPEFDDVIHTDARALLRPRTGLKDMYVQIFPGSADAPLAEDGFRIPLGRTETDVDLDEILAVLDERVREYVTLLANGTGEGLEGRGNDLAELFKRFEPTMRDLARVNRAVASEQRALRSAITSLAEINGRLARRPEQLTRLVDASAATFEAFASEDDNLRETVAELPSTLETATATLRAVTPFATELGLTTEALIPPFEELERANEAVRPFAREATPILRDEIRPFVRASRPIVRDLRPIADELGNTGFPELTRSVRVLNRFFNMLAFNPNGREAPGPNREEGFLFWLAWTSHLGVNLQNIDDANGPMRPLFLTGTCATLTSLVEDEPELEFLQNLSPIFTQACKQRGEDTPRLPSLPDLPSLPLSSSASPTPTPSPTVVPVPTAAPVAVTSEAKP